MKPAPHAYLGHPRPAPFAHRGYSAKHPENTMAAFAAAIDLGYQYVETDVHATADGVLVAFHDDRLDRVTDRTGLIAEMDWSAVRQARVDGLEPIPELEEMLTSWPELRINIDPKQDTAVGPLLAVLARTRAWDRVCVGSFSGRRLKQIRAAAGDRLCTSMGPMDVVRMRLKSYHLPVGGFQARCIQVPPRQYGLPIVDAQFIAAAHRLGLPVHVWTINREAEMHRLLDLGVDAIMTDEAETLKRVFQARGIWPY